MTAIPLLMAMAARAAGPAEEFPAFQNGGALTGEIAAAPKPPLTTKWTYKTKNRVSFDGGPAIANGVVYLGDSDGSLRALDAETGKELWIFEISPQILVTPLVHGGVVYFGDSAGNFYAVDGKSGEQKWKIETEAQIHASATITKVKEKDAILFCADSGILHCVDLDGKELWTAKADDRINSTPAISGGLIYMAGCDGKLRAVDLETGKEKLLAKLVPPPAPEAATQKAQTQPDTQPAEEADNGILAPGSPVVEGESVIVGTDKGHVFSFEKKTLKLQWVFSEIEEEAMVQATAAVTKDLVVVGAKDHVIYAIERASGKKKWSVRIKDDVESPALIAGGLVYVAGKDASVYVLDLATGKQLDKVSTPRPIVGAMAATGSKLIVGDSHGNVICFESEKK